MRTFVAVVLTVLTLALAPAIAEAGGGTKPNAFIRVVNNGSDILAVIVDPSGAILTSNTLDAATFLSAGGRFVGPGGLTLFVVKAGTHTVTAAYVNGTSSGSTVSATKSVAVTVSKGKTFTETATGSTALGVTFSP